MSHSRNIVYITYGIALSMFLAGCRMSETSDPLVRRPSVKMDPCAERLHDVCGQLLLYHSAYKRLPRTMEELKTMDSGQTPELTCPISGEPYIYNLEGLLISGHSGHLVLYDAKACNSGMRWGILVDIPTGNKPLTARVVLLPDDSVSQVDK